MSSIFSSLLLVLALTVSNVLGQTTTCDDASECASTTINNNYIYCYGYRGCYGSEIDAVYGAYCYGYQGCYDGVISAGSSLYCASYYSCYSSDIAGSGTYTVAYGYFSMGYAYILGDHSASTNFYVYGTYGAYNSEISRMDYIYSTAAYGLYGAYIDSSEVSTMNVYLYGYYTGLSTAIFCVDTSTCNIYCGENEACSGTRVICYDSATCNIDCDSSCTSCPTRYNITGGSTFASKSYKDQLPESLWPETYHSTRIAKKEELSAKENELKQAYGDEKGQAKFEEYLRDEEEERIKAEFEAQSGIGSDLNVAPTFNNGMNMNGNDSLVGLVSNNAYAVIGLIAFSLMVHIAVMMYCLCGKSNSSIKSLAGNNSEIKYEYQSIA